MKQSRKEIEANLRNKLAHQYNVDREYQRKRYSELWDTYTEKCLEADNLRQENLELKEKIEQYEDWIRRLQEFMDMPEDVRMKEIEKMKQEKKNSGFGEFVSYLASSGLYEELAMYWGNVI